MPPLVIDIRHAEDSRDVVHRAVQALHEGQLVVFPTETVYALAASAVHEGAVRRLLQVKRRLPGRPPLTLATKSADEALDYIPRMSPLALRLARRCWPGPVTLVCPDNHPASLLRRLPPLTRQALVPAGRLGVRVPFHATILDTLRMLPAPIVITSANRTGESAALVAGDAVKAFGEEVQLILDDGRSRFGQCSTVVEATDRLQILRPGVVSEQTLKRLSAMMILFVCTGNTCRSPMAEGICRKMVAERLGTTPEELHDRGVLIMSAGIAAGLGGTASPEAVEVLRPDGIDLTPHESQPVTEQLIRHADYIWTMTRSHRQAIVEQWPEAANRAAVLSLDARDIADPIGGPVEYYRRCADQIRQELGRRLEEISWPQL
ncbi:MAG: L-threonylcarbamoyladenylate synthase [Pirellulales bacterium]|nr:L-threonylcarbamoyladenylate synthase [Pirellulales bacterium]